MIADISLPGQVQDVLVVLFQRTEVMKTLQYTEKLKELYSED